MPATCYRCVAEKLTPGEPFGVCIKCSSMMCETCGNRVPGRSRFMCVMCFPEVVLLPESLGEAEWEPPGGGGDGEGAEPGGGEQVEVGRLFSGTEEFARTMSELAKASKDHRDFFHKKKTLEFMLRRARGYAQDEARREDIDREVGYEGYRDEGEERRRAEALRGAQLFRRDLEAAEARGTLRRDLLADALGVAIWSIGVAPGVPAAPARLARLADLRLRFAVGRAMPLYARAQM